MTVLSHTEENYIKCIFSLSGQEAKKVSTNAIAKRLGTSAASVTDMIQRLSAKSIVNYQKYYGVSLTTEGNQLALQLIRRHRLWETFLVDKLGFQWDEVHDMAEELEHVASEELVKRLDDFLGNPRFDPHGDPIPDQKGNIAFHKDVRLGEMEAGETGIVVGVIDHTPAFLQYLEKTGLVIQSKIAIIHLESYDNSTVLSVNNGKDIIISEKVAANLLVRKLG